MNVLELSSARNGAEILRGEDGQTKSASMAMDSRPEFPGGKVQIASISS